MLPFLFEAFLFCVILFIIKSNKSYKFGKVRDLKNVLPGPTAFPLIGGILQILLLGEREHNYKAFHKACQKYGKTMGFRGGIQEYIVTEEREAIKEILASPNWLIRFPTTHLYHQHTFDGNYGLLFSYGDSWRETRRFTTRTLGEQGFGEIRTTQNILSVEIPAFFEHLNKLIADERGLVQVNGLFHTSSLNVSWALVAGKRFELDDPELAILLEYIQRGTECEFALHPVFSFPIINWIPYLSPLGKFKTAFEQMYTQLQILIHDRRHTVGQESQTNLIDRFLHRIEEEKQNPKTLFTDKQLLATIADLLGASSDTTANSLSFAVLYMIAYPDVQNRVQNELDQVLLGRCPTAFDRSKLPYTEATMWEVMRVANIVPVMIRTAACNTTVSGYAVKAGTMAVLNVHQMHQDPSVWHDPLNFRPDRFLDENGKMVRDHGLLPFGAGKRSCVGQTVGILSMFTFFASLMQKYELIGNAAGPNINLEPLSGFTNTPRPYLAQFKARESKIHCAVQQK